jgi:dephospho-CoA kinase
MNTTQLRRIGLTGGIGSGKSTLAGVLAKTGIEVIDADAVSRSLTAAGGAAIPAIAQAFGAEFINADGSMNRDQMRQFVFTQASARIQLQSLLHPLISEAIAKKLQLLIDANTPLVLIDIPLLVESDYWRAQLDKILVVDCSVDTQVRRVVKRSQLTAEEVMRIIGNQASRAQRLAAADWVLNNETDDLVQLQKQAHDIQLHF